ncbi:beta-lactamase/transpeptidase-like protein, partial [Coprinopsis sp. MPI-PUGE-AT-0042]
IDEWNSTGLAVSVVQKLAPNANSSIPNWKIEYGSYGLARTSSQDLVTPDTLFAIASNSKLFLSISVGLIISNTTLTASFQKRTGKKLGWWTKMKDLIPEEWIIQDEDIERGATIQDLLSHRTGLPRHDFSGTGTRKDTREAITSLRYLRSSATFRQTFQYNNMMYETLSYLPTLFFNQTYESYIQQHLFDPLNMTFTTFSVERAEGEFGHQLAEGHLQHLRDMTRGEKGWLKPIVPYFSRPGEERIWAGAGGVISSARDLSMWMAMLLNDGRHPYTNDVVVPYDVLEFVTTGLVATHGKPEFPETSVKVYGAGQWRYSYQGLDIIEHGGNNPGFKTQVARFPGSKNHGLGIITLSNDGETGGLVLEAAKFRIAEDVLGLQEVDWTPRYRKIWNEYLDSLRKNETSPPEHPRLPTADFETLGKKRFDHPAYGTLVPCLVSESMAWPIALLHTGNGEQQSPLLAVARFENPYTNCTQVLSLPSSRRVLENSPLDRPTYIIQWDRSFSNIQRLTHFDANLFN